LYNHWIIEKKLRTRTMDELTYETFNERTLMVRNLPKEYTTKDVLDIFNNFGVVMRVEMLFKDTEIEKLL
jgi:RNA recognition motif-containing protein